MLINKLCHFKALPIIAEWDKFVSFDKKLHNKGLSLKTNITLIES